MVFAKCPDFPFFKCPTVVKTSTVVNCFVKAGISKDQQASAQSDDDDPFKGLQNQIEKPGDFYPPGTTVEDVISADQNLMSTEHLLSDEELIEEVMNAANGDNGDDDDDDKYVLLNPVCPNVSDIREALQVLHDYMPLSLCGEDIQQKLNALSISIDRDVTAKMKQSGIRTFFSNVYLCTVYCQNRTRTIFTYPPKNAPIKWNIQ